jgi:hypothetical protein
MLMPALVATISGETRAQTTFPNASTEAQAPEESRVKGIAVIAVGASRAEAATLARALYATKLRPPTLDESRARTLIGDAPPENAPTDVRELSELRAAVLGDDAASRSLLSTIAQRLHVEALLLVRVSSSVLNREEAPTDAAAPLAPPAEARLFLTTGASLDSTIYVHDTMTGWTPTLRSLETRFLPPSAPAPAASASTAIVLPPQAKTESKPFYTSAWFWGALAASAFLGSVLYFASQNPSEDTVRLRLDLPR